MLTKPKGKTQTKLAYELLGILGASFGAAVFFFLFLKMTSDSLTENYLQHWQIFLTQDQAYVVDFFAGNLCFLGAALFFIWFFLLLFASKAAYIRTIMQGVQLLIQNQMDAEVPLEGNDELTELAGQINYLARSQKSLLDQERRLMQEREEFIRSLSHDIRNPLAAILSYSEYMQEKEYRSSEQVQEYIQIVKKRAEQIKSLADQLLDGHRRKLERIENGRLFMEQIVFEWESMLEDEFDCQADLEECGDFQATFDVSEIRRIFDNLQSNIQRYADPAQPVRLKVKTQQGVLSICQSNVADSRKEKPEEAMGIGLENIRTIAQQYGGSAEAGSSEGVFSVRILLPGLEGL